MRTLSWPAFPLDNRRVVGILFLAPALIYILLLVGFPFLLAIAFGFSDVTVGNTDLSFVGMRNFERVWENDIFRQVFETTIRFTLISQVFILLFANILAVIFTQNFTGKWFARFIFILPWATPVSLAMIGWLWMFDTKYSPIDYLLLQTGFLGPGGVLSSDRNLYWLASPNLAQISVIFVQVWRMTPAGNGDPDGRPVLDSHRYPRPSRSRWLTLHAHATANQAADDPADHGHRAAFQHDYHVRRYDRRLCAYARRTGRLHARARLVFFPGRY